MNTLYYGDNLDILRDRDWFPNESVDLIYLDPPFNSKRAYNIIFQDEEGKYPPSQIEAFDDTWQWGDDTAEAMWELSKPPYPAELYRTLEAFRVALGTSDMMAYLVMMAIRLWELKRVLKKTGSIFLHCDPTASHYLKIIMDQIFVAKKFRNDIIWKRTSAHSDPKRFGNNYDDILFYTKTDNYTYNPVYIPYSEEYVRKNFRKKENGRKYQSIDLTGAGVSGGESGMPWRGYDPTERNRHWSPHRRKLLELVGKKKYESMGVIEKLELLFEKGHIEFSSKGVPRFKQFLDEMQGAVAQAIWNDIPPISSHSKERLGYPTQKPIALLERILNASSNEGDIVLDPFCGCGTTVAAAEKLGRKWLGIDITILAINLIEKRIKEHFPDARFEIEGIPNSVASAKKMASTRQGKFLFEQWFVITLGGQPFKSSGGGDSGIDGFMNFRDVNTKPHTIIVSVKGGGYGPGAVRDLKGVIERENAEMGILLALESPSKKAITEAASAGRYQMPEVERTYPKIQIFTVEDYFNGIRPDLPDISETLKKAKRIVKEREKQQKLL